MRYSVVIPTRKRAETLRYAVRNVLDTRRDDFELVVHHCGIDAATDKEMAAVRDGRLRYVSVPEDLPMRDNWEAALREARGEYVTILGDDDGLVPGALDIADAVIEAHGPELLSWRPALYHWPSSYDQARAGRTHYHCDPDGGTIRYESTYALRWLYRFKWHYSDMPMIYNSFVARSLVERVRAARGRYFLLNSPDITSGVVNAHYCRDFVWTPYPLSVAGISRNSTGQRIAAQDDPRITSKAVAEFRPAPIRQDWVPEVANLDFGIAVELLALREELGLDAKRVMVDMQDVAEYLARHIQAYPSRMEASREALRAFCQRHGLDYDALASRYDLDSVRAADAAEACDEAREPNVFAAARVVAGRVGGYSERRISRVGFARTHVDVGPDAVRLDFSRRGDAAACLEKGWNSPEDFGTWACDREAIIALPPLRFTAAQGRLRIEVAGRAPHVDGGEPFAYTIAVAGTASRVDARFSREEPRGTAALEADAGALAGAILLAIRSERLFNPALDGTGTDNRPLGFGIEAVSLSFVPSNGEEAP